MLGAHIAAMERQERSERVGLFSLAVHYGYRVVDHPRAVVMPFLNVGGFVQPGIAARAHIPIGTARLGVDASFGVVWELPLARSVVDREDRFTTYGVKPEAGVWVDFGGDLHPTGRVGVIGDGLVASAQVGSDLFLRAALVVDPRTLEPTGWVSFGVRVGTRSEVQPFPLH